MKKITVLFSLCALLAACDQKGSASDSKERARAEGEAQNDVDNANTNVRAKKMEADLLKRYRFYKGVSGNFEGSFKISENLYRSKITFVPTIHILESDRIRTIEEIQDDLNNLHLNAQIKIWTEVDGIGINGCVFENIKPDINTGVIHLFSAECANSFEVKLTTSTTSTKDRNQDSELLATALVSGSLAEVEYLHTEVNSKFNPRGYEALLKRLP